MLKRDTIQYSSAVRWKKILTHVTALYMSFTKAQIIYNSSYVSELPRGENSQGQNMEWRLTEVGAGAGNEEVLLRGHKVSILPD